MDITIVLFIILVIISVAAGYLIALLRQRTPSPTPPSQAESMPDPEGAIESFRIWRTQDSQLHLGMDRQQVTSPEALSPEQRRQLVKMVVDLRPWLEAPGAAMPPSAPAAGPVLVREEPVQAEAAPLGEKAKAPSMVKLTPVEEKAKTPAVEKPAPVAIKSIVEQINDVLQKKLEFSPLKSRDIRLTEGAGGSVIVRIGLIKYDGIEAVPEAEIKALIRQAVAEWEKSTK